MHGYEGEKSFRSARKRAPSPAESGAQKKEHQVRPGAFSVNNAARFVVEDGIARYSEIEAYSGNCAGLSKRGWYHDANRPFGAERVFYLVTSRI
jgi:hypothetical protein